MSEHKGYTETDGLPKIQELFEKYRKYGDGEILFEFDYSDHDHFCRGIKEEDQALDH